MTAVAATTVEFRLLGPLELRVDGQPVALGGEKQRLLIAVLLLNANRFVSLDRLVDELWGEQPPAGAARSLQAHVFRVRKILRDAGVSEEILVTRARSYALRVADDHLDAQRFETLVQQGTRALRDGEVASAESVLSEALALWRGPALADLRGRNRLPAEAGRLEQLRLAALEARVDADLALGRHHGLVAELEPIVAGHPFEERLRGQLMLALYRSGRQADALEIYQATRRLLVEELGIEPSADLRALQQAILRQDESLALPTLAPRPVRADAPTAARLRESRKTITALVAAAAAGASIAITAAVLLAVHFAGGAAVDTANAVAVIDPAGNRLLDTRRVGNAPGSIAAGAGAVWVANADDGTVTKIEPNSGRTRTFAANVVPGALAATAKGVWVAATDRSAIVRINATFGTVDDQIQVGPNHLSTKEAQSVGPNYRHGLTGIAVGGGSVWTGDWQRSRVIRIDSHSDRVLARIPISPLPFAIVANRTGAWIATNGGSRNSNVELIHIGADGRRLSSSRLAFTPGSIAHGEGSVWITGRDTNSLWRLSQEDGTAQAAIPVGAAPEGVAIGYGSVWVANTEDGTVTRIDPATNVAVATIRVGHHPTDVTTGFGRVWVTVR